MFVAMTAEVTPFPGLNAEPAQIDRAASGLVTYVVYCWEGERHRIEEPAVIKRDRETGVCTLEEWWLWGKFRRAIERDRVTGEEREILPKAKPPTPVRPKPA
jgi:hypothetical protein